MLHCGKKGVVMARIGKILAAGLYFVGTTAVSSEVYVTVAPISKLQERVTAEFQEFRLRSFPSKAVLETECPKG